MQELVTDWKDLLNINSDRHSFLRDNGSEVEYIKQALWLNIKMQMTIIIKGSILWIHIQGKEELENAL